MGLRSIILPGHQSRGLKGCLLCMQVVGHSCSGGAGGRGRCLAAYETQPSCSVLPLVLTGWVEGSSMVPASVSIARQPEIP